MTGRRVAVRGMRRARRPRIRRVSARLSGTRAAALLGLLLSGASIYGVTASSAFTLREIEVPALRYTSPIAIRATLAVRQGANLFSLATESLAQPLLEMSGIAAARVEVGLPDRLVVRVEEREPILVWQVGARRFLVDRRGVLFARVGALPGELVATLPVVTDRRLSSVAALGESDSLQPIVLDAATRLASVRPADIGSAASSLTVEVGDESGFVIRADPLGWLAIFGFYTPTLRTTEMIPGQVRLLRSLLADREQTVARVVLADDTSGTYLPKTTPRPSPTARPAPTGRR
jgi:cell division septal protein FtsQ